jgi:hypothetical protein
MLIPWRFAGRRALLLAVGLCLLGAIVMALLDGIWPVPPVARIDFATLSTGLTRNQYLVCPPGVCGEEPDRVSPVYPLAPEALLAAFESVALADRDVTVRARWIGAGQSRAEQIALVQRSRLMRWPDLIQVRAVAVPGGAGLAIYSRSVFGSNDFGVNRARIDGWLEGLAATIVP